MDDWEYISDSVDDAIEEIFKFHPIHSLSDYERRKIIFEYLTETLEYDFDQLDIIKKVK